MRGNSSTLSSRGWAARQEILSDWRNGIWEGKGQPDAMQMYVQWHLDFFDRFYEPPQTADAAILDVGCGYMLKNLEQAGMLDRVLQRLGGIYTGVDPIDEWFGLQDDYPISLHKAMGEDLPFEDRSFDAVVTLGVLDHTLKPKRVLAEMRRVLKQEGTLWFANSFVEGSTIGVLRDKLYHRLGFDEHHRFVWTPKDLDALVRKTGFEIIKTDRCPCTTSRYIKARK